MKTQSTTTTQIKPAGIGSISHGTLKTEDLLRAFTHELELQIRRNGDYYALPENMAERDRLNGLVGEAQDCWSEDGSVIDSAKEDTAQELVNETLPDALSGFAAPYCYFGNTPGDGADFGFWPMDFDNRCADTLADARLNTAAPELLAALHGCAAALVEAGKDFALANPLAKRPNLYELHAVIAQNAIAKATQGPQ